MWQRLAQVKKLSIDANAKSKQQKNWFGKGVGEVLVTKEGDNILIFHETGSWRGNDHKKIDFKNVFRWTLDPLIGVIGLERLRFGINHPHPVFLFYLKPSGKQSLTSEEAHLCEEDAYFGQIHFQASSLRLNWRVIGPKKNEEIDYFYFE